MKKAFGYIITESATKSVEFKVINQNRNFVIAEGIIQEAEEQNRNRRCYAHDDLAKDIESPRQQELVSTGNFKGEAGHPSACDLARQQKIDPTLEQVWYTKLWMEGNYVKANFRGTNNDLGRSFNDDLIDGQKPSFSLRALGTISNEGGKAYVRNLRIITYDRVYFPSHSKAYTQKIISEGAGIIVPEFKIPQKVIDAGNKMVIDESSTLFPISNESVRNYIISESANIDLIRKNFDTFYESIRLDESGKNVVMVDKNFDTIVVPLERHVQNEIMNYICNC